MPELDELLTDDARRRRAADAAPTEFGAAVATGSTFALNAAASAQHAPQLAQLAAYDTVVGPVPHEQGSVYVVGPKDEHTAACTVVPGMKVTVRRPTSGGPSEGASVVIGLLSGMTPSHTPDLHVTADALAHGRLYVFTCPKG